MNIIACVKQVPDTEAQIKVKADGSGIEDGQIKWVMNPYDEYGVEEALRLKEKNGGEVTIVSVGPARAMETIRTALAMGADKGVHVSDPALDNADAFVTASALAAVIKGMPYDIIFCGQRAIDDDSGQVGPMLAELLGIPQLTLVTKLDYRRNFGKSNPADRRSPALDRNKFALCGHGAKRPQRTALRLASRHYESEEEARGCEKRGGAGNCHGVKNKSGQDYSAPRQTSRKNYLRR